MFEIIIVVVVIAILVGLFKLIKKVVTSNFVKTFFKIILKLLIATAISFASVAIISIIGIEDEAWLGMTMSITFVFVILFMVFSAIWKKKLKKSRDKEIADEIYGFKQALFKTRQFM